MMGFAALLLMGVGPGSHASAPRSDSPEPFVAGPCTSAAAPSAPNGTLSIDGGPLGPGAAAGVAISYSFHLEVKLVDAATGALLGVGCVRDTASASVSSDGTFSFAPVLPPGVCGDPAGTCTEASGPYGPYSLGPSSAPPVGYSTSVAETPAGFSLTFVYDLAAVTLTPAGPTVTVSPGAPLPLHGEGLMANGSVAPVPVTFSWSLNGSGWSFVAPPSGPNASVVADPGAGLATVRLAATATVSGAVLAPPPVALTLIEQPTAIEQASLGRTTVDAGTTISVRIEGVGAAGYRYTAAVAPGLALPLVPAECAVLPSATGVSNVTCEANLTYPTPGIAQPTARLTNGYSSSSWQFPDVTVDLGPELSVAPTAPTGYAGIPLSLEVVAANGSGAPPYSGACFEVVTQSTQCLGSPGPSWRFLTTFPAPGTYPADAWAIDADGANGSVAFSVRVVAPLSVGPIAVPSGNLSAGTPVVLTAPIGGGDLPVRYWWNASDRAGSILSGSSSNDGTLSVTFVPPFADAVTVSLTVIDGLGTYAEADRLLSVLPAQAISLTPLYPPPATPVVAGHAFDVAWEAIDRDGAAVRGFAGEAVIGLDGPLGPVAGEVNASGLGPLPIVGNGTFGVPADGWIGGVLNVSIRTTTAGLLRLTLGGASLPAPVPPIEVVISPDLAHLRLFDPIVVRAGDRANATLWRLTDRFGNAAVGAVVDVRMRWGSASATTVVPAFALADGGTGVWVNFTAPGRGGANLTVFDPAGQLLLGPLLIPPVPQPPTVPPATVTLAAAVPAGVLGVALSGIVRRRARRRTEPHGPDEELRRLAEGRGQIAEIVERAGAIDLAGIEAAWGPGRPPADLADWLASLVADGTLGATVDEGGRAQFRLSDRRGDPPQVKVDADALERAIRRRDEMLDDDGPT